MVKRILSVFLLVVAIGTHTRAQTTSEYIDAHLEYAQKLMREHKIPASIILAVAIHESASGTSKIARFLNNHFGIKGDNSNTEIRSSYRDYLTVDDSYDHFLEFLKSRVKFNALFEKYNQYDYYNWARGIQRGGYASSRTWAYQVINIIKKNELYQYDERPDDYEEPPVPVIKPARRASGKTYTVKSGDNLYNIAKARKTTARAIMKKNGLKSNKLKPGQKLKL